MMRVGVLWTGLACCSLGVIGCGQESPPASTDSAEIPQAGPAAADEEEPLGPAPAGQTEPPWPDAASPPTADAQGAFDETSASGGAADDVGVSIMTWDETQELVASKAGKVVVLDLWATDCVPCRREFPHLVELHHSRGDEVACISYSLDYSGRASRPPESYRDEVLDFLRQQGATCGNVLGSDDPDTLYARLNLASIPAVYVYDRQGNLRKRFDNEDPNSDEFTYEKDVLPLVNELLAEN